MWQLKSRQDYKTARKIALQVIGNCDVCCRKTPTTSPFDRSHPGLRLSVRLLHAYLVPFPSYSEQFLKSRKFFLPCMHLALSFGVTLLEFQQNLLSQIENLSFGVICKMIFIARCYASAVLAMALCPSVRPSVCLSVRHKSVFY